MKPTQNWDKTTATMGGSGERLSAGGHIVKIVGVEMRQSNQGREMMVLYFDVDEGSEYDGMFKRKYQSANAYGKAKWPNGGTYYQLTTDKDGNTNPRFKGLMQAFEKSNTNYRWQWQEITLKNLHVGLVFGEEEYLGNDGMVHTSVKARYCCEADKALEQPAPEIKKLAQSDTNGYVEGNTGNSFTEVPTDDLPF